MQFCTNSEVNVYFGLFLQPELGRDPFDILPKDWVTISHNSGMPIYLHRHTRVCTLSRPYFLGPGSARVGTVTASLLA